MALSLSLLTMHEHRRKRQKTAAKDDEELRLESLLFGTTYVAPKAAAAPRRRVPTRSTGSRREKRRKNERKKVAERSTSPSFPTESHQFLFPTGILFPHWDKRLQAPVAAATAPPSTAVVAPSAASLANLLASLQAELGVPVTKQTSMMWDLLSGLGSHDLSAMREILGMPKNVIGCSPCATTGSPFWR